MYIDVDIRKKLAVVRERFLESMEVALIEMDTLLDALPEHEEPAPIMEAIRFRAHRLAGTAASFGYDTVGDLAAQVESAVDHWASSQGRERRGAVIRPLERLLDQIEHDLEAELRPAQ